ncbi:MAG: M4 family metallopeptidase [Homoserinimonas sp.]
MRCRIVPPYLLLRIAASDEPRLADAAAAARRALLHDIPFRSFRGVAPYRQGAPSAAGLQRTIHTADHLETLPGRVVRQEGEAPTGDAATDEAYDGFGHTYRFLSTVYSRASIDDNDLPLHGTVHYGDAYDNAFWDGRQMVFGDGDGQVFTRFTSSLSVIGHELVHGVTQYTTNLIYQGQSGALNESVSDVFGALVEQYAANQPTDAASWLIGEGLFTDQVQGSAIRSLKAPGSAFDDDVLGRDPQPGHMDGYIVTPDDNGGVHLNSGIPNRAFYLVADALGGFAWERAGRIWYDTITAGTLPADADFTRFSRATMDAAVVRFGVGSEEHNAVKRAWDTVGVRS